MPKVNAPWLGWNSRAISRLPPVRFDTLSEREREVLAAMAEGRSNQAICERLFLSPKTVEAYVRNVFTELDLPQAGDVNRRVLAVLAYLQG